MAKSKSLKFPILLQKSFFTSSQFLCCLFFLIFGQMSRSLGQQDFSEWNDLVGYDGFSPWERYMILSPGFMGPNALPVPPFHKGLIKQEYQWENSFDYYFAKGDKTYNWFTRIYLPLGDGRVAVEGYYVPVEYFETSPEIREMRRVRSQDSKGFAAGDVYLSTLIQVAKDHPKLPDIVLNMTMRTASGVRLKDARFTDTPGYYFDVSASKTYERGLWTIRPHVLGGFYVWQTYDPKYRQNDAIQFGGGLDLEKGDFSIKQTVGGYWGYVGNGDFPIVYSAEFEKTFKKFKLLFRYQYGIRDFPFQGLRLGLNWYLPKKIKKKLSE